MAGILTVDTIQSDSSYASTLNVASKMNFAAGMQIGGQDTTFGGMRNRIINGDMRIDQRNAGASITANGSTFAVDRFRFSTNLVSKATGQRSTTAPTGFTNSLLVTSSAATSLASGDYFSITHAIEGFNCVDLNWGAAAASAGKTAATVTVSFWVRSSLTGTFGGGINNSGNSRSYPFSYTISTANTWEQKSVTIAGDTSGTWLTDNDIGLSVRFALGMGSTYSGTAGAWVAGDIETVTGAVNVLGTNGATFYITGVQLEKGSAATGFENRQYGQELALCRRYYRKLGGGAGTPISSPGAQYQDANTLYFTYSADLTDMRTVPTPSFIGTAGTDYAVFNSTFAQQSGFTFSLASYTGSMGIQIQCTKSSHGLSNTPQIFFGAATTSGFLALSSEL